VRVIFGEYPVAVLTNPPVNKFPPVMLPVTLVEVPVMTPPTTLALLTAPVTLTLDPVITPPITLAPVIDPVALTTPVTNTPVLVTVAMDTALLCNTKLPVRSPVWTKLVGVEVPADILLIFFS
jgi:hypothetical protein